MKLAILLFGISKGEIHHAEKYYVDYEKSYENYKKIIFEYFSNKGYDIDVYFTTNMLNDTDEKEICEKYKPIKYNLIENEGNAIRSKNKKLNNVINLCLESGIPYDLILITRFDLLFQKDFDKSNIDFNKFNLVSILEHPTFICDNFYLFPYIFLNIFSNIVNKNLDKMLHFIQKEMYDELNIKSINYILNEHCPIEMLSFYKIIRTRI